MFHFPWFAPLALCIQARVSRLSSGGVSPFGHLRLNVRLATPRSFSQPPTSFIASWHLGIHRTPLVAYLPESLKSPPSRRDSSELEIRVQAPALRRGPERMLEFISLYGPAASRHRPVLLMSYFSAEIGFYPSYALVKERF